MIKVNLTENRTAKERIYWEGMWLWAAMGKSKDRRQESIAYRSKKKKKKSLRAFFSSLRNRLAM